MPVVAKGFLSSVVIDTRINGKLDIIKKKKEREKQAIAQPWAELCKLCVYVYVIQDNHILMKGSQNLFLSLLELNDTL